jgi:hypothetical protein
MQLDKQGRLGTYEGVLNILVLVKRRGVDYD